MCTVCTHCTDTSAQHKKKIPSLCPHTTVPLCPSPCLVMSRVSVICSGSGGVLDVPGSNIKDQVQVGDDLLPELIIESYSSWFMNITTGETTNYLCGILPFIYG